ncbi:hypothetical protein ABZ896_07030 [Streptomyces sp. NPDC047072]|uniref:hypothetical protein n=1 Tax=Streptomyces sp. NPDC047072 TaxID=3154809 RepID=UPI0033CD5FC3
MLLKAVALGRLDGVTGASALGVALGVLDALGDALGEGLAEALGLPVGAAVVEVADARAVADAKGEEDGFGVATGSDFPPQPHQPNETTLQPPSPLPLAWAAARMATAPTVTTAAMTPAVFRRFGFWRCLGTGDPHQVVRCSMANAIAK